jgi:hypothetical protein
VTLSIGNLNPRIGAVQSGFLGRTMDISYRKTPLGRSCMGIDTAKVVNVGAFTSGQKHFLDFHRNAVLLQSARNQPSAFTVGEYAGE